MAAEGGEGGAELRLLGAWVSTYTIRVKVFLEMKGLGYEYIEQDLDNKSELLLESNPVYKKFTAWMAVVKSMTEEERAEAFKNTIPLVEALEEAFKECSKGKPFFGGDVIGYVDLVVGGRLLWIKVVDEVAGTNFLDEAKFPRLAAWAERFLAADAVKAVMPDAGKVMEYYLALLAKWTASAGSATN